MILLILHASDTVEFVVLSLSSSDFVALLVLLAAFSNVG